MTIEVVPNEVQYANPFSNPGLPIKPIAKGLSDGEIDGVDEGNNGFLVGTNVGDDGFIVGEGTGEICCDDICTEN